MKQLVLTLAALVAAAAVALPAASAGNPQGNGFITDTLGGNGHPKQQVQGYRFITDTLAPGGGANYLAQQTGSSPAFSWPDAGIGAAATAGLVCVLLGGGLVATRRRSRLAI